MQIRLSSLSLLVWSIAATMIASCSSSGGGSSLSMSSTGGNKSGTKSSSAAPQGGSSSIFGQGGSGGDPCLSDTPPANCQLLPPACGDGKINQDSEACDDGNSVPGDGCTGICKIEVHFKCAAEGQPCESDYRCGNGSVEPGEVCDDGNTANDDGCDATCTIQSGSFNCPTPGQACVRVEFCGNKRVKGDEECDDGNTDPGDGCNANCQREDGWVCQYPGQPCQPVKVCGDGIQSPEKQEACDDGNIKSGDGCAADCKSIESGFQCASPGQPCLNLNRCGDGRVTGAETCDDANDNKGDGCESCKITPGYDCPFPGALCIGKCGDGILLLNERCDDGNNKNGDGCSSICTWEKGWACTGDAGHYSCHETKCGDGKIEGAEGCDDKNNDLGDGCTPLCTLEPDCTSGACKSKCGDGLVLSSVGEECDDGNKVSGDGCSEECKVEAGYECKQPPLGGYMAVPAVYRDFKKGGDFQGKEIIGSNAPKTGLVKSTLNAEGKPELAKASTDAGIASTTSFAEWYKDVSGVNATFAGEMRLWRRADGSYVNRWGENGQPWQLTTQVYCGVIGEELDGAPCTSKYGDTDCQTFGTQITDCVKGTYNGKPAWMGLYVTKTFDGNPVFFPVDASTFSPKSEFAVATIPSAYDGNWIEEPGEPKHNFHFTSEVRYWFMYSSDQTYTLDFLGDDDVWVFINKQLAVDLGGIHTPVNGVIKIGAGGNGTVTITQSEGTATEKAPKTSTVNLGLKDGQVYEIVVFQAERQTTGSSYKLTLSGFNAAASVCGPICGDGVLAPGEQCDDGTNAGGYGKCQPGCVRGPYCGDKVVNGPEECDNGSNVSAYGSDGCAPGCVTPARCGDKKVQSEFGETCDDGVNDGSYGGCSKTCAFAPRCGDGEINGPGEECDDGANDGTYNNCAPGCKLGPRCGDGLLQEEFGELCEVGDKDCSANCQWIGVCGDTIPDKDKGEECDDGQNDGGYGECGPNCKLGPRCGDGVTQPEEACDGGESPSGAYGECAANCVLAPHCGDGIVQSEFEECDDGNKITRDGCTACRVDSAL